MRKQAILGSLLAAAVLAAIVVGLGLAGGDGTLSPGVVRTSGPLPDVAGRTLTGTSFSSRDYRGKVLVVNFWNPYCTPCRQEATVLDLAAGRLRDDPVVLLGVLFSNANFPHEPQTALRFATELGEPYPTVDDPSHEIAGRFGIRGIPVTVIADRRGRLRYEVLGTLRPGQLEGLVRRVLRR